MSKHLLVIGSRPLYNATSISFVPFHKIGGKDFCCVTHGGPVLLWEMTPHIQGGKWHRNDGRLYMFTK